MWCSHNLLIAWFHSCSWTFQLVDCLLFSVHLWECLVFWTMSYKINTWDSIFLFAVTKILLSWRRYGLLLEFTLTNCIFLVAQLLFGVSFTWIAEVLGFHCTSILLGSIQAAGVCSSGAMAGIDLGHLEKGLLKARAFQEKGWALLGAPSNPWVCHLGAFKSKMSDCRVKCKEFLFTC